MAIDEIDQAALAARWGDAEADLVDVICRALDEPRPTVIRVLHAAEVLRDRARHSHLAEDMAEGIVDELGFELRTALRAAMERGLRRIVVRRAIAEGGVVRVLLGAILKGSPIRMCAGCPVSLRCVARSLSTPARCASRGLPMGTDDSDPGAVIHDLEPGVPVCPVRLRGDALRVECAHPRGTWDVDIMDVVA